MITVCEHCGETVIIEKINCGVFRHGVYKNTGKQISPHMGQKKCDKLIKDNLIYGCGKEFKIPKKT